MWKTIADVKRWGERWDAISMVPIKSEFAFDCDAINIYCIKTYVHILLICSWWWWWCVFFSFDLTLTPMSLCVLIFLFQILKYKYIDTYSTTCVHIIIVCFTFTWIFTYAVQKKSYVERQVDAILFENKKKLWWHWICCCCICRYDGYVRFSSSRSLYSHILICILLMKWE